MWGPTPGPQAPRTMTGTRSALGGRCPSRKLRPAHREDPTQTGRSRHPPAHRAGCSGPRFAQQEVQGLPPYRAGWRPRSIGHKSHQTSVCAALQTPASQDGSPGATNLPLVLGEQLGTAEEVLVPGEGDHGLGELPQVEFQQRGHRVHVCCAVGRGTCMRPGTPGSPRSGQHLGPLPQGQPPLLRPHACSRVHS